MAAFKRPLSLFRLMILLVSAVALATGVLLLWIFISHYAGALRTDAATTTEQSIVQATNTINAYTSDTKQLLHRVAVEIDQSEDTVQLKEIMEMIIQMREDLTAVAVYTQDGALLDSWAGGHTPKAAGGDFDLKNMVLDSTGCYLSQPHVQNLFESYYPWVVTVSRPVYLARYDRQVFVAVDLQFSSMAKYLNDVGIGQHGYSFVIDRDGNLVYHPQQQLIYTGIKQEDASALATLPDGVYVESDAVRVVKTTLQGGWRVVGVCYLDEMVDQAMRGALRMIASIVPLAILVLGCLALVIARVVSAPLHKLICQMHGFEQNASGFIYEPVKGPREICVLSDSFAHMVFRLQRLMVQVKSEQELLRKTEFKVLQAQINPHFLYNTLDSIQWMCEVGRTDDAVKMVGALAKLFRTSISRGEDLIPLREELEHAQSYLTIQKFRYKDQFSYRFEVEPGIEQYLCNKSTLQPIIENAILHGFGEYVDDGEIIITARSEQDDIVLTVQDNGVGMDLAECEAAMQQIGEGHGIGVKNVNDRVRISFGAKYGVSMESKPDYGTCVTIRFAKERRPHETI